MTKAKLQNVKALSQNSSFGKSSVSHKLIGNNSKAGIEFALTVCH